MNLSIGPTSPGNVDLFSGCLLGGAVGDALGAPVEFDSLAEIRARFGKDGIRDFAPAYGKIGAITDDTQMTLFTAEGLIRADNRGREKGICHPPTVVYFAYLRWLETQGRQPSYPFSELRQSWLLKIPELNARRSPGNTCLSALQSGELGTIEKPINNSKGCGGVMRVAPVGLAAREPFRMGCEIAAITHGHPTGYLAAGFLAELIAKIVQGQSLWESILSARDVLTTHTHHEECLAAVGKALSLAERTSPVPEAVGRLGQGWVAEEALAMSLYCSLVADSFEDGVTLAVNHSGDSDSTGAITGNVLGALLGRDAIPARWLEHLELRREIEEISSDLFLHFGQAGIPLSKEADWEKYPGS